MSTAAREVDRALLEPERPRVPPELARSLSRLASAAHRFHRFAHHPLCGAYAAEVIALGRRTRVCRGCACLALGAVAGLGLGLSARALGLAWPMAGVPSALTALAVLLASLRWRMPKLVSRALPAVGLGLSATAGWPGAFAAVVVFGVGALAYRSRGPDRAPCAGCPQRRERLCDGVRPVVRRERAVMRLSSARVARALDS